VFSEGVPAPATEADLGQIRSLGGESDSSSREVARYISEVEPLHDLLRRGLIQLSGFLLKRTIAGPRAIVDCEPVEAARGPIREAAEGLRNLRAPTSAAHHRGHLAAALVAIESALAAALSTTDPDGDALFHFVQEAERHLRAVGRATPGFEAVDLRQACCAMQGVGAPFEARFTG